MSLPPNADAVLGRLARARREEIAYYLASIVDSYDDAILTIDLDGVITSGIRAQSGSTAIRPKKRLVSRSRC
jgi:hypothetical protein